MANDKSECSTCGGDGIIEVVNYGRGRIEDASLDYEDCPDCHGESHDDDEHESLLAAVASGDVDARLSDRGQL